MSNSDNMLDGWSVGHFMSGFIAITLLSYIYKNYVYVLGIGVVAHQVFELWENGEGGISFFNGPLMERVVNRVPLLKFPHYSGDTALNTASDTLFFTLGGLVAYAYRSSD